MKKFILGLSMLFLTLAVKSQILKPVGWSYAFKKQNGSEAIIYIKAIIDNGWHIYSASMKDGGPVKTTFTFAKSPVYSLIGPVLEPKPIKKFEETFGMQVSYFEKTALFVQRIKLKAKSAIVKGNVGFMTCDDKQCLPPEEVSFSVAVK